MIKIKKLHHSAYRCKDTHKTKEFYVNFLGLKFDLIFSDPPFQNTNIDQLIELIFNNNLLSKKGIIILHRNKATKEQLPDYFKLIDERIYGISKIIFGKFSFW